MNFRNVCELCKQNGRRSALIFSHFDSYMFDNTSLCLDICMSHLAFLLFFSKIRNKTGEVKGLATIKLFSSLLVSSTTQKSDIY